MNLRIPLGLLLGAVLAVPVSLPAQRAASAGWPERAVRRDIPMGPMIRRAHAARTRDSTGAPGQHYWQQSVDYAIDATLDVATATLRGHERITLHNSSPDTLATIVLRLYQNYFRAEESRNDYVTDITDGMKVEHLAVNGAQIALGDSDAYTVDGTIATIHPPSAVLPGATATMEVDWSFEVPDVPQGTRGERMGRWGHELYQVAQWYPQVAMYDDLRGWDTDQYLGTAEFYNQYGSFDVRITLPAGWLVGATGTLENPEAVLSARTRERLALAMRGDSTVHVVTAGERAPGVSTAQGATLTWHFTAPLVNDFAFAASKDFVLDATRAMAPKPTLVQVLYWPEHSGYAESAQYARFALEHFAKVVMPYDFPQATVTDGPETGMEYPMIIFSGPGFGVIAHELGHQWFPMMVGSNETWYGWQDEGLNEYIDGGAEAAHTGHRADPLRQGAGYRGVAGSELEPPMMWPSDFAGPLYGEQAYAKAPLAMWALGGVTSDSAVSRAFAEYARAWRYKHPSPWDFFAFMQRRLGQDLGWFWNAWWFTTERTDQSIAGVAERGGSLTISVRDLGDMAMPVIAGIEFTDGSSTTVRRPASVWFAGSRTATITEPLRGKHVARVTLDPENRFQDVDRSNNEWSATPASTTTR
ncbi:MAG TPA: M1 family metallopeptidase [Gemmatimonadaceae bacterium]